MTEKTRQPLLPKYLKAIGAFFSKDETRPILTTVHLTNDYVVATDSYRLVKITYEGMGAQDFPKIGGQLPMEGTLDRDAANIDGKTFIKALSSIPAKPRGWKKGALPVLHNVAVMGETDHTVSFGVTDLDQSTIFVARKVEGTFPPYEDLMAGIPEAKAAVAVDAKFLQEMAKAVLDFGGKHVTISVASSLKPVKFTASNDQGGTFTGLQMPVRLQNDELAKTHDLDVAMERLKHALTISYPSKAARNRAIDEARDALDALLIRGAE